MPKCWIFPPSSPAAQDLGETRRLLAMALVDVTETYLELGQSLPAPNPQITDPDMDLEEPIYLHLTASTEVEEKPAGGLPRKPAGIVEAFEETRLPTSARGAKSFHLGQSQQSAASLGAPASRNQRLHRSWNLPAIGYSRTVRYVSNRQLKDDSRIPR